MSETVITALITLTAGAVGAVCGVIGAVKSARIAQKSQMHARVDAYSLFFEQWSNYICANYNPALLPQLIAAIEKASMLTTPSTTSMLADFRQKLFLYAYSEKRSSELVQQLNDATMNLRLALQYDLLRYYAPDIAELPEDAKLPNEIGRPRRK